MSDVVIKDGMAHGVTGAFTAFSTETYCGITFMSGEADHQSGTVSCPECLRIMEERRISLTDERQPLTINGLVDMSHGTAKANGWHDRKGEVLTEDHPIAQMAGGTMTILPWLQSMEAVRKPQGDNIITNLRKFADVAEGLNGAGIQYAAKTLLESLGEYGKPVDGSRTQLIAWTGLQITELVEAVEAIVTGDKAEFAVEYADTMIRIGDTVGAINGNPDHPFGPIDMEAVIRAKNEKNKARGYRHGNKTV